MDRNGSSVNGGPLARRKRVVIALATLLVAVGCAADAVPSDPGPNAGEGACSEEASLFASSVEDFEFGPGQSFGQAAFPDSVLGPPSGGGCCAGSLQVTSLGDGGFVTLGFEGQTIVDAPGADFIVFENAFRPAGSAEETTFVELGEVSVSQDGVTWFTYPCTATAYPYGNCAGWRAVSLNAKDGPITRLDAASAGGDPFDLADVGLEWCRYVKVTDRTEADAGPGTFDLDAVGIVHPSCPAVRAP
jgi:hypothetical protein